MRRRKLGSEKIELNMTSMIDIVFQLLTFFIFTLKIVSAEGDFGIKMPLGVAQGSVDPNLLPPIKVRMISNADGQLAGLRLNDRVIDSMEALRLEIIGIVGDQRGPGSIQESAEVELDCDYQLNYEHVINAITAVSGYTDDSGNLVKLVEKIKFTPPKGSGSVSN
ncbi:MAG: ExbD/TolR family protein [Pirellulaceae bacterium]